MRSEGADETCETVRMLGTEGAAATAAAQARLARK